MQPILLVFALGVVAAILPGQAAAQQRQRQPGWPCTGTVDPSYVHTAEATGGVVMLFKPAEIGGAAAEMSASMRHEEVVFRKVAHVAQGTHEIEVPLDSTIESAFFFISLQCLEDVTVVRPEGLELRSDAVGVEYHQFTATRMFTVAAPVPGSWSVRVTGRGFLSIVVKAKSDLRLAGVTFADGSLPLKADRGPQRLAASMSGAAAEVGFELVSSAGDRIDAIDMVLERETDTRRAYSADITPPAVEFRLAMTGLDTQGFPFRRLQKQLVSVGR